MEPISLFNLADNPKEDEDRNLIRNPEYESKVKAMYAHYMNVRSDSNRTAKLP